MPYIAPIALACAIALALTGQPAPAQTAFEPSEQQVTGGYSQAMQDSGRNQRDWMLHQIEGWHGYFAAFEELFGTQPGFTAFAQDFDAIIEDSMIRILEQPHISEAVRADYVGEVFLYMNEERQAVMFDLLYRQYSIDGGVPPEDLQELRPETRAMMAREGMDEGRLLQHIFAIHRLEPFEPPTGLDLGVALTLHYPANLSRPLAWRWKDEARPIETRLEIANRSDLPVITVTFTVETDAATLMPPTGRATCTAAFTSHECRVEIAQGAPYTHTIALRPGGRATSLPPPFERDETIAVSGTATAPGAGVSEIPPASLLLPFRDCDGAFRAAMDDFETGFRSLSLSEVAETADRNIAPSPNLTGRAIFGMPPMREYRGATGFAARLGLERPQPDPATLAYEDMTFRQQTIYTATQVMRLRGRDPQLRDEGERIAAYRAGVRSSAHLAGLVRDLPRNACPGTAAGAIELEERVRRMERSQDWIAPRQEEIAQLTRMAAGELERHVAAFEAAQRRLGTEPNDDTWIIDLPTRSNEAFNQIGPFVTGGTRTLVSFTFTRLTAAILERASVTSLLPYALNSFVGPLGLAINFWNLANISLDAVDAYEKFRIAARWTEVLAYLQHLADRYDRLAATYAQVIPEYRALTDAACTCRYE